jgi:hypothetical protein
VKKAERGKLDFGGLRAAPSQAVGTVRLVPLVRDEPIEGLCLYAVPTRADLTVVKLDPHTSYTAYVPHALMAELPGRTQAHASAGSQLVRPRTKPEDVFRVQVIDRLARRERAGARGKGGERPASAGDDAASTGRLRLLPQHLALDAYLSVGFGGPDVVWPEYSRQVLSRGLSPRTEHVHRGRDVPGLADALRVFERHPGQVGVLVFVADAFAAAFVTPRPEDYRRLHRTLLEDMYGELLVQYAVLHPEVAALWGRIDGAAIASLDALAGAVEGLRREWSAFAAFMASGLLEAELEVQTVQRLGGFRLQRFLPSFHPHAENHVGEAIVDAAGRLAYLQTFRLSAAQARRGRLLSTLVAEGWDLDAAAAALGATRDELFARLRNNGLGPLLKAHLR